MALRVGDLRAALLQPLRRGPTTVLIPDPSFGVGNLLYYALQADARRRRGQPTSIRWTGRMQEWTEWFPRVFEDLTLRRGELSFFSPRETDSVYQDLGREFSPADLRAFVSSRLLDDDGPFTRLVAATPVPADLTINIRRGDYYRVPAFRGRYSFDVVEYVRVVLAAARETAEVSSILLVSDDLDWCRTKLGWLAEDAELRFPAAGTPIAQQLALLAASPRLVLTNSTFSYWGAYLSNQAHGDNHAQTYAPWFHSREWNGGGATQLDPRWSIIRDIPGGWDG